MAILNVVVKYELNNRRLSLLGFLFDILYPPAQNYFMRLPAFSGRILSLPYLTTKEGEWLNWPSK